MPKTIPFIFAALLSCGHAVAEWKITELVFPGYCPWGAVKAGVCRTTAETFDATPYLKTTGKVLYHPVNVVEFPLPCAEEQTLVSGAEFVISWGTGRRQSMRYVLAGDHSDADGESMSVESLLDNPDRSTKIHPTMDDSYVIANFDTEACTAVLDTEMVDASYPFQNTIRRAIVTARNASCDDPL